MKKMEFLLAREVSTQRKGEVNESGERGRYVWRHKYKREQVVFYAAIPPLQ